MPIPVPTCSKEWVDSHSHVGIASSNAAGGIDICL